MISSSSALSSAPAGYRFPREVIAVAVRWYLRYASPEFIEAARPARHATADRWFVDETYVKVAGGCSYLYRAVDQRGQVIDVLVSTRRDAAAAREFFTRALRLGAVPVEVTTDLVKLAASDHRMGEHPDHGGMKCLAAVNPDEDRAAGVQPAITQPGQQIGHHGRVLRRTFSQPERVLAAIDTDPERDHTQVLTEVHPVDHQRHQIQLE